MEKKVSVIIPCRNEKKHISRCLTSLVANDYRPLEILVIDGDSKDGTKEILKAFEHQYDYVHIFENDRKITPVSMNIGVKNATGEYIMIAGAHSSYPVNYISGLVKFLDENSDIAGAGGWLKTLSPGSYAEKAIETVLSDKYGVGNSLFRIGSNKPLEVDTLPFGLYKKTVFDKAGLYNEKLVRNQDIEWSKRVLRYAGRLFMLSDIYCNYYFAGNFKNLAKSGFRNGYWNMMTIFITKNFASLSLRHFIPLIFILSIVLPVFISIFHPFFLYFSLIFLGLYLLLMTFRSIYLKRSIPDTFLTLWSFVTLHFSYGIGSFIGLFQFPVLFKNDRE